MAIHIPAANWTTALADTIRMAPDGATIAVHTEAMLELARRVADRMDRQDLEFCVGPPLKA